MDGERNALQAIIWAGACVIGAGIVFVFAQLLIDVCLAMRVPQQRYSGQSAGYSIGVVILMIGAALIVTAVAASRPRPIIAAAPAPASDDGNKPLQLSEKIDGPQTQTELSLKVTAGVPPKPGDSTTAT